MRASSRQKLNDKWVVVTGAASGIGRATALAFARQGAHLVISDLDCAGLESVAAEARLMGVKCHAKGVDVSDEAAMRAFAAEVEQLCGAPHVLINNAGIGYLGGFSDTPPEIWRRIISINLMGVVHGCMFFLPGMNAAGGPRRIVNVASLAGITAAPNMSAYAASKFAVMGLSETLSLELELRNSQVQVTMICPGIINTAITRTSAVSPGFTSSQLERLRAFYEANGAPPELVAQSIVDAVCASRELVLVGPFAALMYHVRRVSRAVLRRLMLIDARKMGYS